MVYIGAAQACDTGIGYAVISSVPYTFEGYTNIRIHFDYNRVDAVHAVKIAINGNIVYYGSDYSDKYYTISTGSSIEAYTAATTSSCDGPNPSEMYATITVYK